MSTPPDDEKQRPAAAPPPMLDPDESTGEDAEDLPQRNAMSLIDPGLLGGVLSSGGGLPTGAPSTDGTGGGLLGTGGSTGGLPTADPGGTVGQSTADATQLAGHYTPPPDPGQPYQPIASDTAQS